MSKSFVLTLILAVSMSSIAFGQKFGYTNSSALMAMLPETKEAESNLQTIKAQLTKQGQQMVKDFQDATADLNRKKEAGTISPKDYQTQSEKLNAQQEKIANFEGEASDKLSAKQKELYQPIIDKLNKALEDVSKENQFTYVFDVTSAILLYADESLDVTNLVKAKLGVK